MRRLIAPAVVAFALLAVRSGAVSAFVRIFDSMWLHELGHAIVAWLSGYPALPGPWKTTFPDSRAPIFAVMLAAALVAAAVFAWRADRRRLAAAAGAALAVQLLMTLAVRPATTHALMVFGGDAGAMVLGALLVALYDVVERDVRWGLLVLGAFGFANPFTVWWRARHDLEVIDFGTIEGVGDSDPTVLVEQHGWTFRALVDRHFAVGVACLVALVAWWLIRRRGATVER